MDACPKQQSWFSYFKENMDDMGLPVPTSWYGTQVAVTGSISSLVAVQSRFGARVTIGDLAGAGAATDGLVVIAGMSAAWYLGGAIGSSAVATGRHLGCGTRIIDVISYASRHRMLSPAIQHLLIAHPEIYDSKARNRRYYGMRARNAA